MSNGICQCVSGYVRDSNGFCEPTSRCPANSTLNQYGCCVCNSGFTLKGNGCVPEVQCIENSFLKNGLCYCNDGYVLMRNTLQCKRCGDN